MVVSVDKPIRITRLPKDKYLELIRGYNHTKKSQIFEPQLPLDRASKRVSENVVTPANEPIPECTTCGVCCDLPLVVPISNSETERFSDYWEIYPDESASDAAIERVLPREADSGRCVHLAGELGVEIGCRIYPQRPTPCRDFEAGSDRCHEYRRMYGIERPLSRSAAKTAVKKIVSTPRGVITYAAIVVESTGWKSSYIAGSPGGPVTVPTTYLRIAAIVDDNVDDVMILHSYEASEEVWFESDFIGLTPDAAKSLIESRGCRE